MVPDGSSTAGASKDADDALQTTSPEKRIETCG